MTIEFEGATFEVADKVSALAFMRFAKVAKEGVDSDDMAGMVAMLEMLEQCIAPSDWQRFQKHADTVRADGEQLLKVVQDAFAVLAQRPTGRSSDSSAGPQNEGPSSTADSSSPDNVSNRVIGRLNAQGRPDLALMARKHQESLTA